MLSIGHKYYEHIVSFLAVLRSDVLCDFYRREIITITIFH